ncbi:hypothetical protein [Helicobacter pylori]|uniref:hypothetical protein n=1 Tax=Helicobacter pylori TaxID=210 RepID=UPI00036D1D53|nr:hypothetical protein [Helicobacter pylori]EQL49834.1 hypothetical protein N403_07845 [Helicobacter pylori FD430]
MWNEKNLKIIPVMLFLFCVLEILELSLIVYDMNKIEKIEKDLENNLQVIETIINSLDNRSKFMQFGTFKYKKRILSNATCLNFRL